MTTGVIFWLHSNYYKQCVGFLGWLLEIVSQNFAFPHALAIVHLICNLSLTIQPMSACLAQIPLLLEFL